MVCAALVLSGACWEAFAGRSPAATAAGPAAPAGRAADAGPPPARSAAAPDDPLFRHQWNLPLIQIPSAWAISRGAGATVAVLDTGVAYADRGRYRRAPDLAGTRFVAGWDFVDDDPHPHDVPPSDGRRSHGTQMAAIIAQTAGNALGGAGVAPEAAIMPVRVLRPDVTGTATAVARGLRFAVDHGADVINLSIAGASQTRAVAEALEHAAANGVLVIAAAGNDGGPAVAWPAADRRVVAIGAVARDLSRARYSNHGRKLDLVAPAGAGDRIDTGHGPGDGVIAQALKGGPAEFCFCFSASTSAAAAQVSGVAALLVGSGRARTRSEIRAALLEGARDLGPRGRDAQYGAGLVQARGALQAAAPAAATTPAPGAPAQPRPEGRRWSAWAVPAIAGGALAAAVALVAIRRRRRARPTPKGLDVKDL